MIEYSSRITFSYMTYGFEKSSSVVMNYKDFDAVIDFTYKKTILLPHFIIWLKG